ncbi:MAG: RNA polymerase sigma factor [Bacteroidota bacterium]
MEEKQLLQGLATNDRKSVEAIYQGSYNSIQSLIINNQGSIDDARDIFQETLIVLYEKVRQGDFELNCQIRTYLYAVSKRLWLKKLQQQRRMYTTWDDTNEPVSVDTDLERHEQEDADYDRMQQAIQQLGEPCKSLLEAYYLRKQNMASIASEFGYTNADNAKNQKYKCLMRLKKIFFKTE